MTGVSASPEEHTVPELVAGGREVAVPFLLRLQDENAASVELVCLELFRLLPGRRLVARCTEPDVRLRCRYSTRFVEVAVSA